LPELAIYEHALH